MRVSIRQGVLAAAAVALTWAAVGATPAKNEVEITERGGMRYITANGIPEHSTGRFPNHGNPNTIRPQSYSFRMTTDPQPTAHSQAAHRWWFAVGLNGVPFEPGTAEAWKNDVRSGWNIEAFGPGVNLGLDQNNAHVQPGGEYHYHGVPTGLVRDLGGGSGHMTLVGYAADGFPIYSQYAYDKADDASSTVRVMASSWRLKSGSRPGGNDGPGGRYDGTYTQDYECVAGLGDLDELNGRTGVTPEYPDGIYYYVITESFPYISRGFRGRPDSSFAKHMFGFGGGGMPMGGPPPGSGRRDGPPPWGRPPR